MTQKASCTFTVTDPPDLTRFKDYVEHYLRALDLEHWRVFVSYGHMSDHEHADCQIMYPSKEAWVRLNPNWHTGDPRVVTVTCGEENCKGHELTTFPADLDELAAHEVCHIWRADTWNFLQSLIECLPGELGRKLLRMLAERMEERAVADLTKTVLKAFPKKGE